RLAREYARPDAAEHAREARLGAQRVELGRLLEQRERADAEMIRRVERVERRGALAERGEVARALELDHALRAVRGARVLERRERVPMAAELALGLRDPEPAQP